MGIDTLLTDCSGKSVEEKLTRRSQRISSYRRINSLEQ